MWTRRHTPSVNPTGSTTASKLCRRTNPLNTRAIGVRTPIPSHPLRSTLLQGGADAVKPFLEKSPMKYTVGLGSGNRDQLPVTVVLDRDGKTVKRFDGLATRPK
jgi:hypothetical protein